MSKKYEDDYDDDVYDYEDDDYCYECTGYGDDYYINEDGEWVDACAECPFNPSRYDEDGYDMWED